VLDKRSMHTNIESEAGALVVSRALR
jgi:hypothetical protein